jgi:hypothetical protein
MSGGPFDVYRPRTTRPALPADGCPVASGPAVRLVGTSTHGVDSSGSGPDSPSEVEAARDRHPTALGRQLDTYLAEVAKELQARGVITGPPQRSDPAQRLTGSIELDCLALCHTASSPTLRPDRPAPVAVVWDEETGWCAEFDGPARSARQFLGSDLLPTPTEVADFIVSLAQGRALDAAPPLAVVPVSPPLLRLVR